MDIKFDNGLTFAEIENNNFEVAVWLCVFRVGSSAAVLTLRFALMPWSQ